MTIFSNNVDSHFLCLLTNSHLISRLFTRIPNPKCPRERLITSAMWPYCYGTLFIFSFDEIFSSISIFRVFPSKFQKNWFVDFYQLHSCCHIAGTCSMTNPERRIFGEFVGVKDLIETIRFLRSFTSFCLATCKLTVSAWRLTNRLDRFDLIPAFNHLWV